MDSNGYDICQYPNKSIQELVELCIKTPGCIAFNTNGYLKYKILEPKLDRAYITSGGLFVCACPVHPLHPIHEYQNTDVLET